MATTDHSLRDRPNSQKYIDIRKAYEKHGYPPSTRMVRDIGPYAGQNPYAALNETWDHSLAIAEVPTVADITAEWITNRPPLARTFTVKNIADDVGPSINAINPVLTRFKNGTALITTGDPAHHAINGDLTDATNTTSGPRRWYLPTIDSDTVEPIGQPTTAYFDRIGPSPPTFAPFWTNEGRVNSNSIESLESTHDLVDSLPAEQPTFRIDMALEQPKGPQIKRAIAILCNSWPLYPPTDTPSPQYVNPNYERHDLRSDNAIRCPCGSVVTDANQQAATHADDCPIPQRTAASAALWDHRLTAIRECDFLYRPTEYIKNRLDIGTSTLSQFRAELDYHADRRRIQSYLELGHLLSECKPNYTYKELGRLFGRTENIAEHAIRRYHESEAIDG